MIGRNYPQSIALRPIAAAIALLAFEVTGSAQAPSPFTAKPDSGSVFLSPDQTKTIASFFVEKATDSAEKLDLKLGRWLANGVERKEPADVVLAVYPADAKSAQTSVTLTITPPGFGTFEYEVFQGTQTVFRFQVFRPGVELKFPEGKPNEPVVFREDRDTWLILENHTPQNAGKWSLRWRLRFGSQEFCGDGHDCSDPGKWPELAFSGPGERHFAAKARRSWFVDPATDKLFPETRPAALTLRFADAAGTQAGEQVLTFQSRYVATPPRDSELFWSAFRKFLYVLLGALASVFLGVSISNLRHKVALKKRLNQIATRIRNIPGIQDSEFEAGLRGKRIALENLRKQLGFVWPSYRTIIDELQPLVTSFEKRLSLVEALARQQIQAEFVSKVNGQCVYSRFAAADQTLQAAAVRLRYANPTDADLGEASQLIDKAVALLKPPSDEESAALAASLVDRIQTFAANTQPLSPLSRSSVEGLPEVAPRLSALLDTFDVVTDRHAAITEWVQRNGVAAADVEFAIAEAWADLNPGERSAVGERFKTFIAVASLAGVRSARRMVTQTRTAASRQVLLAAVKQEKVRIVVDREQPRFDEAIVLAVQFDQANLNEIAPLSGILPRWTLDSTDLDGWTVSRYIPSRGTATKQPVKVDVRVKFLDISEADGKSVQPPEISRSIEIYPVRQRTEFAWKELILFGAGFLPALVAAAWQTTEASLVPLFTLGFTADKIKEAIAGRDDGTTNT